MWVFAPRMSFGGSLIRPEATGYGLVFFIENMLQAKGDSLKVRHDAAYCRVLVTCCAAVRDSDSTSSGTSVSGYKTGGGNLRGFKTLTVIIDVLQCPDIRNVEGASPSRRASAW